MALIKPEISLESKSTTQTVVRIDVYDPSAAAHNLWRSIGVGTDPSNGVKIGDDIDPTQLQTDVHGQLPGETLRYALESLPSVSIYEPETQAYIDRVETDGGQVMDPAWVDAEIVKLKNAGIYGSVSFYLDVRAGVKLRQDGENYYVEKAYDMGPQNHDFQQQTASRQPLFDEKGFLGSPGNQTYLNGGNPPGLNPLNNVTFQFWFRTAGTNVDWAQIVGKGNDHYLMRRNSSTGVRASYRAGSDSDVHTRVDSPDNLNDGQWHSFHSRFSYGGASQVADCYTNYGTGNEAGQTTGTVSSEMAASPDDVLLLTQFQGTRHFNGWLNQVLVIDTLLELSDYAAFRADDSFYYP